MVDERERDLSQPLPCSSSPSPSPTPACGLPRRAPERRRPRGSHGRPARQARRHDGENGRCGSHLRGARHRAWTRGGARCPRRDRGSGPPAAREAALSLPGGVPGHRRGVGSDLHLVWREPGEDQAGGDFGLAVEAAVALACVDLDHGEARRPRRQPAMLARANKGAACARRAPRGAHRGLAAIRAQVSGAPAGVHLPAVGSARRPARLQRGAARAAGRAIRRGIATRSAQSRRAPGIPPGALVPIARSTAFVARGAAVCRRALAAADAKARLAPFVVALLAPGAPVAAAELGALAAIEGAGRLGLGVAPAVARASSRRIRRTAGARAAVAACHMRGRARPQDAPQSSACSGGAHWRAPSRGPCGASCRGRIAWRR